MSKAVYWQKGEKIDYVNNGAAVVEAGEIVVLGTKVCVAGMTIPVGEKGTLVTEGVFKMPKASGEIAAGSAVYYDATSGNVTTTANDNAAGWAIEAAESGDTEALVKLG